MRLLLILLVITPVIFTNCSTKKMRQKASNEAFRANPPSAGTPPEINLGKHSMFTLDNGLKVIVVEDKKLPRVSMQYLIDVPPVKQSEYAGYIDLTAEWLLKGTEKRSKTELDDAIDFMGAKLSSRSDGLAASCLTRYKEDVMGIMAEVIRSPKFDEAEFNKIKNRTQSAIMASSSDPDFIAGNVSKVIRYGQSHPYGEIMTLHSLERINPMICKGYHKNYYRPNVSYLAIVGDITESEARALVEQCFGDWEPLERPLAGPKLPVFPDRTKLYLVDKAEAPQSVVRLTYPMELKYTANDRLAAMVMNTILGGFFNSRLNLNLREDKGYTYGVRSGINADQYVGYFSISGSFGTDVSRLVVEELLKEMNDLRLNKVSEEELERARQYMMGTFARSLERPQTIAQFALNQARYGLGSDYYESYLDRLAAITVDDIQAAAIKYLRPQNASILMVGDAERLKNDLKDLPEINDIVFMDKEGNTLDQEKYILPTGLDGRDVLARYIENIGVTDSVALNTLLIESEGTLTDIPLRSTSWFRHPQTMKQVISSQGQTMQELLYKEDKVIMTQMGQVQELTGEAATDQNWMAYILPEQYILGSGYEVKLKDVEQINGKPHYLVEVSGMASFSVKFYFDVETGLKSRMSYIVAMGNQLSEQQTDYSNYREVEGIKFPYRSAITGQAMPAPLILNVKRILVNPQIDDEVFNQ